MNWDILITAGTGLVSGAIGSLAAPWALWGIEKKRKKLEARASLIASIRDLLKDPPSSREFRLLPIYSQLRPYLSHKAIEAIEGEHGEHGEVTKIVIGECRYSGINPYVQETLDEVARLEKLWDYYNDFKKPYSSYQI